jgi:hypothetical protein
MNGDGDFCPGRGLKITGSIWSVEIKYRTLRDAFGDAFSPLDCAHILRTSKGLRPCLIGAFEQSLIYFEIIYFKQGINNGIISQIKRRGGK